MSQDAEKSTGHKRKRVLVLGGTTFMGRSLVRRILREQDLQVLVLVNRGRTYWREEIFLPDVVHESASPAEHGTYCERKVRHVSGDRTKEQGFAETLFKATLTYCANFDVKEEESLQEVFRDLQNNVDVSSKMRIRIDGAASLEFWDAVVDFSAFNANDIKCVEKGLLSAVRVALDLGVLGLGDLSNSVYVYISSDSCYEVCEVAARGWSTGKCIKEDDAVRPQDKTARRKLENKDSYGHGKLEAEEALYQFGRFVFSVSERPTIMQRPMTIVCLRLPDVIGPYDDTGRLWAYWFQVLSNEPIVVREASLEVEEQQLAFVFAADVARLVLDMTFNSKHDMRFAIATSTRDSSAVGQSSGDASVVAGSNTWDILRHGHPFEAFQRDGSFLALNLGCVEQMPLRRHLEMFRSNILRDLTCLAETFVQTEHKKRKMEESDQSVTSAAVTEKDQSLKSAHGSSMPSSQHYDHNVLVAMDAYAQKLKEQLRVFEKQTNEVGGAKMHEFQEPCSVHTDRILQRVDDLRRCTVEEKVVGFNQGDAMRPTRHFLPSVDRIQELDFSLLRQKFPEFEPTKLEDVYVICHRFFLLGTYMFPEEATDALKKLDRNLRTNVVSLFWSADHGVSSSSSSSDSDSSG